VIATTKLSGIVYSNFGEFSMKRSVVSRLGLAAVVLSLPLLGCGSGGVDPGLPAGDVTKPDHPMDPKFTDMTGGGGKMGPGAAAAAAKGAAQAKANPAATPEEPAK
jgi:hypothetical protein